MKPYRCSLHGRAALIALGLLSACAGSTPVLLDRPARDTPDHFLAGSYADNRTTAPTADGVCHSPMVDPRDGRPLRMVRSGRTWGDYEAPAGSYGLARGELLRLSCDTGQVLGIVRR